MHKKGYAAVLHPTVTSSFTPKNSLRADNMLQRNTATSWSIIERQKWKYKK